MQAQRIFLILLFITSINIFTSYAQEDNDPTINPDANACNEGGSMEGRCNSDSNGDGVVTQEEIDWAWNCGWHLIRHQYNMIPASSVPANCAILLSYELDSHCISGHYWYSGLPNTEGNFLIFPAGCWNGAGYDGGATVVTGDSYAEAKANCDALYPGYVLGPLYQYPGSNENLWYCFPL